MYFVIKNIKGIELKLFQDAIINPKLSRIPITRIPKGTELSMPS